MFGSNKITDEAWKSRVLEKLLFAALKEQRAARRWGIFFKLFFAGYLVLVLFSMIPGLSISKNIAEPHIAVVNLKGMIASSSKANSESIMQSLNNAFASEKAKAVILKINSPGGSPVQSDEIYLGIKDLREKYPEKKIYAVISDVGASGAYYIAAATDEIYANRSSLVGSIGALYNGFGFVEGMKKIGVERRLLTAGKNKAPIDPFSEITPQGESFVQDLLDDIHAVFIERVKAGRGDKLDSKNLEVIFSGLAWSGEKAKTLGLIDGFYSAEKLAKDIIGIEKIVDYTAAENLFERITSKSGVMFKSLLSQIFNEVNIE